MNSSTRFSGVLWIAVALVFAGFGQGCNVIKSEAEHGDAPFYACPGGIVPEGEEISVLCNGTDLFSANVVGDQGAFSINLGTTTGACVFQDIAIPNPCEWGDPPYGTYHYECSDVVGNPDVCTVNVVSGKFSYAYESVLLAFKCMEVESCISWCGHQALCPGARCTDCDNYCHDMLCP